MLRIIDDLGFFFEDAHLELGIREYARLRGVSPPTAATMLRAYEREGLLVSRKERRYVLFRPRREEDFTDLCRMYWRKKLEPLTERIAWTFQEPLIVLFGSAAKGELRAASDIDLAVFTSSKKDLVLQPFEKKLGREIQFLRCDENLSEELRRNVMNGYVLAGNW